MREYLTSLLSVSLLGGLLTMLSPEGDLKKYVRLLCSLCLLCAMVSPLFSAFAEGELSLDHLWEQMEPSESLDYDEIYHQSLQSGNRENAKNIVKRRVLSEFELSDDALDVEVFFDIKNEQYSLEEIRVILHPKAIFVDPQTLSEWINETYSCPCVVIYD